MIFVQLLSVLGLLSVGAQKTASGCDCKATSEVIWFLPGGRQGGGFSHAGCGTGQFEDRAPAQGKPWCDTLQTSCNNGQGWDFCGPQNMAVNVDASTTPNPPPLPVSSASSGPIRTLSGCTCHPSSEVIFTKDGQRVGGGFSHYGCGTGPYEANSPGKGNPWCDTIESFCTEGWDLCVPPTANSGIPPPPSGQPQPYTSPLGPSAPQTPLGLSGVPQTPFSPSWQSPPSNQFPSAGGPSNQFSTGGPGSFQSFNSPMGSGRGGFFPAAGSGPAGSSPFQGRGTLSGSLSAGPLGAPFSSGTSGGWSTGPSSPQVPPSTTLRGAPVRRGKGGRHGGRSSSKGYDYDYSEKSSGGLSPMLPLLLSQGSNSNSFLPFLLASSPGGGGGGSSANNMLPFLMASGGGGGSSANNMLPFLMFKNFREEDNEGTTGTISGYVRAVELGDELQANETNSTQL